MVKIKICGVRTLETVRILNELEPAYAGFVFAPSKRRVAVHEAKRLVAALDPAIARVGVFVDAPYDDMQMIRERVGLDVLQLHGKETPSMVQALGGRVWKALNGDDTGAEEVARYESAEYIVLDAMSAQARGGTSRTFCWDRVFGVVPPRRLVLAGGLHPGNVRHAIRLVGPAVVDVSSGVETDAKKDPERIRSFIQEVRTK